MKWYTCTPVNFEGNERFFTRDSGLFSRAFQAVGVESCSVVLGPAYETDVKDGLIRASLKELESAVWWRSLEIDGVLLYSWGAPQYKNVAKAIHEAGVKLIVYLDSDGDGFSPWLTRRQEEKTLLSSPGLFKYAMWIKFWVYLWAYRFKVDRLRCRHLSYADVVTIVCPYGVNMFHKLSFIYGSVMDKVRTMACPVPWNKVYDHRLKLPQIISIGRWDDIRQKRPEMLIACLSYILERHDKVTCLLYGTMTDLLKKWHESLPEAQRLRVFLKGIVPNEQLNDAYNSAQVSLCTSTFEGSHNVSAEALCSGASVVAPHRPGMRVFEWYVSHDSGTLSEEDSAESLGEAVLKELSLWESGQRDPEKIATYWQRNTHATSSVKMLLSLFQKEDRQF